MSASRALFSLNPMMLSLLPLLAALLQAPGLPGGGGPVTAVPVDAGLSLLAVAGGAYAVRRLRERARP